MKYPMKVVLLFSNHMKIPTKAYEYSSTKIIHVKHCFVIPHSNAFHNKLQDPLEELAEYLKGHLLYYLHVSIYPSVDIFMLSFT